MFTYILIYDACIFLLVKETRLVSSNFGASFNEIGTDSMLCLCYVWIRLRCRRIEELKGGIICVRVGLVGDESK